MSCALRSKSIWLVLVALAPLASGCCLPQLSGRCQQPTCEQCGPAGSLVDHGRHELLARHAGDRHWHGFGADGPGTPPGEVIPVPKFHPVPTRPVFEPLPQYAPARSLHGGVGPFPDQAGIPTTEPVPTPAQPVPDPA